MWTDMTRAKYARKGLRYSSDLTDTEWGVLELIASAFYCPFRAGSLPP